MNYVSKIVSAFGGVRPMARALEKAPSTVKSWEARGSIPDAQKADILRVAEENGLGLEPEDFFPRTEEGTAA